MDVTLKKKIEVELMRLPATLLVEDESAGQEDKIVLEMEKIILTIREDVKKGNRLTFKLLQELQFHLENMEEQSSDKVLEEVSSLSLTSKSEIKKSTNVLLEVFDLLDLVRENTLNNEEDAWVSEISNVVDNGLELLADYGIEEIAVIGEAFDGSVMDGIGTVPQKDVVGTFNKYDVYTVFQRGFRYKDSKELVRRAKVITVY